MTGKNSRPQVGRAAVTVEVVVVKAATPEIDWSKPLRIVCSAHEKWRPATRLYVRNNAHYVFKRRYCNIVAPGAEGSDLEASSGIWVNNKGRQFGGENFVYVRNKKA